MGLQFEFDLANKILLIKVDVQLTDESLTELYQVIRKYSTATDASAAICDFSSVVEFAFSSDLLRQLGRQELSMPNATTRPRVILVPQSHAFGLFRMFQITGEPMRPLLTVVRTMDEALAALGVQNLQFEPLEPTTDFDSRK